MKKKILLTLAAFAAFAALTACNKSNVTTKQTTTEVVTTTADNNNSNELTNNHDRGTIDNSLPKIDLPDVLFPKDEVEQTLDATDKSISLGDEDYVETNAGSGQSEIVEGERYLTATVNVGYNFLGWYLGDKLLSTELKYKCKNGEDGVEAKFALKEGFEYFEFTSSETECVITGLKENNPSVLVIPEGVTEIGENAFRGAEIVNVTLPESLNTIGERAFYYSHLTILTFKKVPSDIGWDVVDGTNLKVVVVPNDYNDIDYLVENELSRSNVYGIKESDINYHITNDFIFHLDEGEWDLIAYTGSSKDIVLPEADDVVSAYYIVSNLFYESDIESIKFSTITKSIGYQAFYNCDNLSEVTLSNGILTIMNYAFYDCDSLAEIVIPDSVTYIGEESFEYSDNLSIVTIGKNVETIDYDAFYGCNKLSIVYDYSDYLTITKGEYDNGRVAYYAQYVFTDKSQAEDLIKDDFIYEIDENYVTLLTYTGNSKDVVIPTFDDKFIILGNSLFSGNNRIETVTFNEYCIEIESYAFSNCDNLKKINTAGVIDIDSYAFNDCNYLEEAILPNVDYIGSNAFNCCYGLKTVECPKLIDLGSQAFYYCGCLESIDLTNVTEIENETFYYCTSLKEAIMNEAASIGSSAFYECRKLEKAIMPKATSIGNSAFRDCYKLRTIDISSLESIGYNSYIFYNCYSLITITFPATLTSVDSYSKAFDNYSNTYCLREIINYSGLNNVYNTSHASNEITNPEEQESRITYEGNLIIFNMSGYGRVLVGIIDRSVKKIVVPADIVSMSVNSLYGCDELEELEINSLDSYLGYYFDGYHKASNSMYAYSNNYDCVPHTLKTLKLGDGITEIPNYALYGLSFIENLYIGKNVNSISSVNPFDSNKYKNIYYDGTIENWCSLEFDSLNQNPSYYGGKIYFKNGDSYSELEVLEIPDTVTAIGDYQFYRFSSIKKVILPNTITSIGSNAFYNCKNLKGISIESSLLTIGSQAFEGCNTLISVKLGDSLTAIGDYAFKGCSLLYNVEIPNTLSSLGVGVFKDCETLESLTLEDTSVTQFKDYLFSNCYNLESLGFPTGLTAIESTTFENCDKLVFRVYKNGCYFGTETNPYRWLIKARAKTIVECEVFPGDADYPACEKIYDGAFSGCKNLKKIIIPATCTDCGVCLKGLTNVQYIEAPYTGTQDFGTCFFGVSNADLTGLKTIVINGGAIATSAFVNIPGSIQIILDGNITSIGNNAFKGTNITSFTAPASLKTIGAYAFQNCKSLETVDLGSITTLGTYAFSGCIALESVKFSNSLATISQYAFEKCSSLSSISLTTSITKIDGHAFENSGVEYVYYGTTKNSFGKVNEIGTYAFSGSAIKKVVLTDTVGKLLSYAFYNCKSLETVSTGGYHYNSYNNEDNTIQPSTFEGCTALTSFTSTCDTYYSFNIGSKAFYNCTNLKTVSFKSLSFIRTSAFENSGLETFIHTTSVSSYEDRIYIYSSAFKNCKNLTTVAFNEKNTVSINLVLKNGSSTSATESVNIFEGCSSLVSVKLPKSFTTVTQYMFKNCTSLAAFDFSNITTINQYAFQNTGFKYLELPETITTLGIYAFVDCTKLETAILYRKISSGTFSGCTSLKDVTLSGLETTMPYDAFYNCSSLESIELAEGLTIIGDAAFSGTALTSLTLPSTLTKINVDAFRYTKIESVTIPSKVTTFGNYIFADNNSLKEVIIEEGVTTVPNYAFYNCSSLESVTSPSTLTSINQYAFYGCSSLASIIIPTGVSSIGSNAFNGCNNLKTIYNYSNLEIVAGETSYGYIAQNATSVINYSYDEVFFIPDEDGFVFTIKDDKYYLVGYNGTATEITLPTTFTYNEVDVTEYEIYQNAFYGNTTIIKLTIPSNVKAIKEYAFAGCTNIINIYNYSDIELTKGSKSNGYVAYYATTITTPYTDENNQVTDENGFIFAYVDDKGYLVGYNGTDHFLELPDSFEYEGNVIAEYEIYKYAFKDNLNIFSIKIPASVTAIVKDAFKGCDRLIEVCNLSDVVIGGNEIALGLGNERIAIHDGTNAPVFVIENGFVFVTGLNSFENAIIAYLGNDTEITIPYSFTKDSTELNVSRVNQYAFANSNFEKVTIPFEINIFDCGAFKDATINELVFENGNSDFGDFVFGNCKIFKATIPAELIPIVNNYDSKNTSLTELTITSGTEISANALRDLPLKKVVLPDTITSIGEYAFYNCSELKEISLPSGLLTIGECAFRGCTKLESIVIPESLDTISYRAFYRCDRLRYITIMNKDVVVEDEAFYKTYIDEKVNVLCNGSEDDFADFEIDVYNGIVNAKKCYYRASKPSGDDMFNYWHYDSNGLPVIYKYEEQRTLYEILVPRMKRALQNVKDGVGNYSISETGSADSYIIKNGDTYTITMKAYMRNIEDKNVADSDGYKLNWGIYSSDTSTLIIGINDDGFFLVNTPSVTTLKGYEFFCDEI